MKTRAVVLSSLLASAGLASNASAANYQLDWLNYSPTAIGSPVPNGSTYFLPGAGNVTVTYNIPQSYVHARGQVGALSNGNVPFSGDTYQWNSHENFGATSFNPANPPVTAWDITYTFQNPQPAGRIFLGVNGLGRRSDVAGATSVATVFQNGTFIGDWGSGNWGATQFTPGAGQFAMQNSVTGIGGADPHWNTRLGVVRIDDPISSLTVRLMQAGGDGVGVNIAAVPPPGAASLAALAGLAALRRRRA